MARFTNSRNSYVLEGISTPISDSDAANKRYVDSQLASLVQDSDTTYTVAFDSSTRNLTLTPSKGPAQVVNIPGGQTLDSDTTYAVRFDAQTRQLHLIPSKGDTETVIIPGGAAFGRFALDSDGLVPGPNSADRQSYNYLAGDGTWQHITGYNVKRVAFHTHWERNLSTIAWNTGDLAIVTVTGGYYGGYGFSQGLSANNQIYVEFANATEAAATRANYLLNGRRIANLDGGRAYTITNVSSLDTGQTYPRYTVTLDTDRQGSDFQNYNAVAYYDSDGFDPGIFIFVGTNGDSDGTTDADWSRIQGQQDHFGITLNPRSVTITDPNGVEATIPAFGSSHAGVVPEPGTIQNTNQYYLSGDGNWQHVSAAVKDHVGVFDADSDGLVPHPETGENTDQYVLTGNNDWTHLRTQIYTHIDSDLLWAQNGHSQGVAVGTSLASPGANITGNNSIVIGTQTIVGNNVTVIGHANTTDDSDDISIYGDSNDVRGGDARVYGHDNKFWASTGSVIGIDNTIGDSDNLLSVTNTGVIGQNNTIRGRGAIIGVSNTVHRGVTGVSVTGNENIVDTDVVSATIVGNINHVRADNSQVFGIDNEIYEAGDLTYIVGDGNHIHDSENFIAGSANRIWGSLHTIIGRINRTDTDTNLNVIMGYDNTGGGDDSVIFGRGNNITNGNTVAIGRDIYSDRQGVFIGYAHDTTDGAGANLLMGPGDSESALSNTVARAVNRTSESIAIGHGATVGWDTDTVRVVDNAFALGSNTTAPWRASAAIGQGAATTEVGEFRLGGRHQLFGDSEDQYQFVTIDPALNRRGNGDVRDNELVTKHWVNRFSPGAASNFPFSTDTNGLVPGPTAAQSNANYVLAGNTTWQHVDTFGFNLERDTRDSEVTTFNAEDKFLVSVDSENNFTYWGDITQAIFSTADGVYERKIPHATEPLAAAPSGALNVSARVQAAGQIRTASNIASTTPSWGFYDQLDFSTFPTNSEVYTIGSPTTWGGYFSGTHRYLAINFGINPSFSVLSALYNGHVGTSPIYLVAYRNATNWAMWKLNTGVSQESHLLYVGRQAPTLVEFRGTPGQPEDTTRWTVGLSSSAALVTIIDEPAFDTRVLANGPNGPEYSQIDIDMFDTDTADHYGLRSEQDEIRANLADLRREWHEGLFFRMDTEIIAHADFLDVDVTDTEFVLYAYPKDATAWQSHASNIRRDWSDNNNVDAPASMNMGFKFFNGSGFTQRFIYVYFGPTDSDAPVYYDTDDNTFRIVLNQEGSLTGARLDDGHGNTIANAADQEFGPGYFDHLTFYSNATFDSKIFDTSDFDEIGYRTEEYLGSGQTGAVEVIQVDSEYRIRIDTIGKTSISDDDGNTSPVNHVRFDDNGLTVRDTTNADGTVTATITSRFRGGWSTDVTYSSGDLVTNVIDNRNVLFRANTGVASGSAFNHAQWDAVQGGVSVQDRSQNSVPNDGHEIAHFNFADANVVIGSFNGNRMATVYNDFRREYILGGAYHTGSFVVHNNSLWERTGNDISSAPALGDTEQLGAGWAERVTGHRISLTPTEIITGVVGASQFLASGTTTNGTQYVRYGLINPASNTDEITHYAIFYLENASGDPTFFEVYPDDGQSATTYTAVPTSGRVARRTFTGTGDNITWIDGV